MNHEITCVEAELTDATDSTNIYTTAHKLDCEGCAYVLVTIKIASAIGAGTEVIEAKII